MKLDDPMIDELRAIRAQIAAECAHDLARLGRHLQQIEQDYASRTGLFAGVPMVSSDQVTAQWQEGLSDGDPLIDELRAIRAGHLR